LPLHLEGKVTRSFNISEIISNQIPDEQGRTVPLSVHEGSAMISGSQGESEHILLVMDAGTYNVQKATCGTNCKTCTGAAEAFVNADPWALPMASTRQETFTVQYNTGKQYDYTSAASWTSGNTSIATVSAGKVTARAVGADSLTAEDGDIPDYSSGCYTYVIECPLDEGEDGQAPGGVPPTLTITDGLWFFGKDNSVSGYPTSATITANGASGGTFNWSIPTGTSKISFSSSSSVSSTETSADSVVVYSTGYSTSMGDVSVALSWSTPDGETLAATPLVFQVDAPYTQAPYADSPVSVPTVCGPNNSIGGYSVVYSFSAVSFFQNPLTSVPVNESFGTRSDVYGGNKWPSPTPLPHSGIPYGDTLQACGSGPPLSRSLGSGDTEVFSIPQTFWFGSLVSGSGIPVQTDTVIYYTDHAVEANVITPVR
jgi:hypothetical protein